MNSKYVRSCFVIVICSILFISPSFAESKEDPQFTSFAVNYQRTGSVSSIDFPYTTTVVWDQKLPMHTSEFNNYSHHQWMVQNSDAIFFHTDTSIVRINKDDGTILQSTSIPGRMYYGAVTYTSDLDVLICSYFQNDVWSIAIYDPVTLEEIQVEDGFCFSFGVVSMGVMVVHGKIYYLQYIDEYYHLVSLDVGKKPNLVYSFSKGQYPSSFSVFEEYVYCIVKSSSNSETETLLCIDVDTFTVIWKHDFSVEHSRSAVGFISYPVCTKAGIFIYQNIHRNGHLYSFHPTNGEMLWKIQLPHSLTFSSFSFLSNMTITANNENVCLYTKVSVPWEPNPVNKVFVVSTEDGNVKRDYTVTDEIQKMLQTEKDIVFYTKNSRWLKVMDIDTGAIKTATSVGTQYHGSEVFLTPIVNQNTVWLLSKNRNGDLYMVKKALKKSDEG